MAFSEDKETGEKSTTVTIDMCENGPGLEISEYSVFVTLGSGVPNVAGADVAVGLEIDTEAAEAETQESIEEANLTELASEDPAAARDIEKGKRGEYQSRSTIYRKSPEIWCF